MTDDDFSNEPLSITEARANRSGYAKDMTARDTVVAFLRDIDSGVMEKPDFLVICFAKRNADGEVKVNEYEPALGPVNWDLYLDKDGLFGGAVGWLICGGESAKGIHRPMDLAWAYAARDACRRNGVPFFMKQIDKVQPIPGDLMIREFPRS